MQFEELSYFEAFLELARKMDAKNEEEIDKITAAIIAVGFSRIMADDPSKARAAIHSLRNLVDCDVGDADYPYQ